MQKEINQETPQTLQIKQKHQDLETKSMISSYEYMSSQSCKQLSQSNIPISYNPNSKKFLSENELSVNETQSEVSVKNLNKESLSKEEIQKRNMLIAQQLFAKMQKTRQELYSYINQLTENSTQVFVIKMLFYQQLQQIINIWMGRPIKKPTLLMRLSIETQNLQQNNYEYIAHLFKRWPSILLKINGKEFQNNKPIFQQNNIYYQGDDQFMICYNKQNQQCYYGGFKDKKYHGKGQLINRSNKYGFIYNGDFQNGKFQGKGQMRQADSIVYVGDFKNDLKNGNGVQTKFVAKKAKTKSGKPGKPLMVPTIIYRGQFYNGEKHGKGTQEHKQVSKYEGFWVGGNKQGPGHIEFLKTGDQYEGDFLNNQFNGKGKYTAKNNHVYEGDFLDGKYHGFGKMTYVNEDVYEGEFQFDKKHGQGVYTWSDGDYYDGNWIKDSAQGKGTSMIGQDFYDGQFKNGIKHGEGTLTDSEGEVIRAIWQEGIKFKVLEINGQIVEE